MCEGVCMCAYVRVCVWGGGYECMCVCEGILILQGTREQNLIFNGDISLYSIRDNRASS